MAMVTVHIPEELTARFEQWAREQGLSLRPADNSKPGSREELPASSSIKGALPDSRPAMGRVFYSSRSPLYSGRIH